MSWRVDAPCKQVRPEKISEVLEKWVCTWMWKYLQLMGNDHWLEEAIEVGAYVAVTELDRHKNGKG